MSTGTQIYPGNSGVCYWGHTTDRSLMKLCTDGRNYVCPQCCHEQCRIQYPGMYAACSSAGWPVWPPGSTGRTPGQKQVAMSAEWEYHTIEIMAPKGRCFDVVPHAQFTSEASARLIFWYRHQSEIMQAVQLLLDQGWEPIGEIGPGCLIVKTSSEYSKGLFQTLFNMSALGYDWWLIGVRIPLRRRKK